MTAGAEDSTTQHLTGLATSAFVWRGWKLPYHILHEGGVVKGRCGRKGWPRGEVAKGRGH